MNRDWNQPPWHSSYLENNYGDLFYALVRAYRPTRVIELGTKAGYSAYHMAKALKANGQGSMDCYDLWEKYEYNSAPKALAAKNLSQFKDIVQLNQRDVQGVDKEYSQVDVLHVDLGNHGQLLDELVPLWLPKVQQFIIVEGGSKARDKVEWMVKYHKRSIHEWLEDYSHREAISYFTMEPFPSVTIIQKSI